MLVDICDCLYKVSERLVAIALLAVVVSHGVCGVLHIKRVDTFVFIVDTFGVATMGLVHSDEPFAALIEELLLRVHVGFALDPARTICRVPCLLSIFYILPSHCQCYCVLAFSLHHLRAHSIRATPHHVTSTALIHHTPAMEVHVVAVQIITDVTTLSYLYIYI